MVVVSGGGDAAVAAERECGTVVAKAGGWLCALCSEHNFAARAQCFRCNGAEQGGQGGLGCTLGAAAKSGSPHTHWRCSRGVGALLGPVCIAQELGTH